MPKITRATGPSYTDEAGDPVRGPVGMVVDPTVPGDVEVEHRTDEHGQVTQDITDRAPQSDRPEPFAGNVSADGHVDTDASAHDGQFRDPPAGGGTGQFEPSTKTVKQVEDYLEAVGPDERVRVLNAEANGKNRSSLVTGRYANQLTDEQRDERNAAGERSNSDEE